MGRWKIAEVYYSPFEYNPVTGSILVAANTNFILSYKTDAPLPAVLASKTTWDADAASMLCNYADTSLGYAAASAAAAASTTAGAAVSSTTATASTTASYVIITTSAIQSGVTQLSAFIADKQALGYTVAVETESAWGGGTGETRRPTISAVGLQPTTPRWGSSMSCCSAIPIRRPATCR